MIAVGIMATIMVILFGTYSAAIERAARARDLSQVHHEARVLLQLMANDLRPAFVKEPVEQAQQAAQQAKPQPSTFVGEDHTEFNAPADTLEFSTFLPAQRPDLPEAEICRVGYSIEPLNETPASRALSRRVNCSLDPTATNQEQLFVLTELAHGIDFKYYDQQGTEYLAWNSSEPRGGKRMPARLKVTLWLMDQHGRTRPFEMLTDFVLSR
jgi:hypothetical protein